MAPQGLSSFQDVMMRLQNSMNGFSLSSTWVEPVARDLTEQVSIPTIGIGASPACDGQILVSDDMLGMFADFTPKFVKKYAQVGGDIERAVKAYAQDVRSGAFPGLEHCYGVEKK